MTAQTILSKKLTSQNLKHGAYAGFIDKCDLDAKPLRLKLDDYINSYKSENIEFEVGQIRSSKAHYIMPKSGVQSDMYILYHWFTKDVYKFLLDPSVYSNFHDFTNDISKYLGKKEQILNLKIVRIDKAIDISLSFPTVERGVIVTFKRFIKQYGYESGKTTGFEIGKSNEVVKFYDKTKKAKLNFNCTRIEVAQKGSKISFPTLLELQKFWYKNPIAYDYSFKNIQFNDLNFPKQQTTKSLELKTLTTYFPFMVVRSRLNSNGNFDRNYKKHHKLTPWGIQPDFIFNSGIRKFFNHNESGEKI